MTIDLPSHLLPPSGRKLHKTRGGLVRTRTLSSKRVSNAETMPQPTQAAAAAPRSTDPRLIEEVITDTYSYWLKRRISTPPSRERKIALPDDLHVRWSERYGDAAAQQQRQSSSGRRCCWSAVCAYTHEIAHRALLLVQQYTLRPLSVFSHER